MATFGIKILNQDGQILVDEEHVLPKLYHYGSVALTQTGLDGQGRQTRYGIFEFPPTQQPVLATYAVDENLTPSAKLRYVQVRKNVQGQYYGIYVAAAPEWAATAWVWVYLL